MSEDQIVQKLSLSLCISHIQTVHNLLLSTFFYTWRDCTFSSINESSSLMQSTDFESGPLASAHLTDHNLAEARDLITFENKIVIRESPLFEHMEQVKKSEEVPMALTSIFRFFEEMMDKKYEADQSNLKSGRPYLTIPEFFLDHLIRVYGLKKLAQKSMIQMLITLKQLNDQGHGYGKLLCQLLHIFDFNPIDDNLAFFLTKARFEMNKVIGAKKSVKAKRMEEVHIVDAFNLVTGLLPNDKFARAKAINLIRPKVISDVELFLFKVLFKMIRLGMTVEQMFTSIDSELKGRVSIKSISKYIQRSLEILIEEEDFNSMNQLFDTRKSTKISKQVFISKLIIKPLAEYQKQENLTIPKSQFLSNFVLVYNQVQLRKTAFMTSIFKSFKKNHLNTQDFAEAIKRANPMFVISSINQIYDETLMMNSDCSLNGICLDAFTKFMEKYSVISNDFGIGYLGLGLLRQDLTCETPEKEAKLKKQSSEVFPERKEKSRRSSNILERGLQNISRGSTPVDNSNKARSKSPAFGMK